MTEFEPIHYQFHRYRDENVKFSSQQYRVLIGWPGSILVAKPGTTTGSENVTGIYIYSVSSRRALTNVQTDFTVIKVL